MSQHDGHVRRENEWKLLEEIVKTFKPFDELTTYFSEIKYDTLSVVNTSIEALKLEFYGSTMLNEIEGNISDNGIYKNKI
ncbi:hypothetical protein C2G38_2213390 [Gigaspora rosea]|uniref:Uncharacterized protein n=1 Tax=Gigaspora rosea TaxID=44941 RepID=A0A397UF31_9GLOM|nr:hypothetical protein C2G38_2213390 [Gigaspora rosea]